MICEYILEHSQILRIWVVWRWQRMCSWAQLQGKRQVISLTYRIISSLVANHIVSHLSDFLAYMLHLHSIKREQVIFHHQSNQHKCMLRIQYVSKITHVSEKKKFSEEKDQLKMCISVNAEMLSWKYTLRSNADVKTLFSAHLQEDEQKRVWQTVIYVYICHWYSWLRWGSALNYISTWSESGPIYAVTWGNRHPSLPAI